jgi:hypothetical protein
MLGCGVSHSFEWKSLSDEHQWSQNNQHGTHLSPLFSEIGKPGVKSRLLSKIRPQVIPAGLTGKPLGAGGRYRFELVSSFDILWPR